MAQFESKKTEIEQNGALLFIAAEKRDGFFKPAAFLKDQPTAFPFLLDEDRRVTKAYGVYKAAGIDSINIARPASFLVNPQGLIDFSQLSSNRPGRVPVETPSAALAPRSPGCS